MFSVITCSFVVRLLPPFASASPSSLSSLHWPFDATISANLSTNSFHRRFSLLVVNYFWKVFLILSLGTTRSTFCKGSCWSSPSSFVCALNILVILRRRSKVSSEGWLVSSMAKKREITADPDRQCLTYESRLDACRSSWPLVVNRVDRRVDFAGNSARTLMYFSSVRSSENCAQMMLDISLLFSSLSLSRLLRTYWQRGKTERKICPLSKFDITAECMRAEVNR